MVVEVVGAKPMGQPSAARGSGTATSACSARELSGLAVRATRGMR